MTSHGQCISHILFVSYNGVMELYYDSFHEKAWKKIGFLKTVLVCTHFLSLKPEYYTTFPLLHVFTVRWEEEEEGRGGLFTFVPHTNRLLCWGLETSVL